MSVKQPDDFCENFSEKEIQEKFDQIVNANSFWAEPKTGSGPRDWELVEDEGAFVPPSAIPSAFPRTLRGLLLVISVTLSLSALIFLGLVRPSNSALWATIAITILAISLLTIFNSLPNNRDSDPESIV